MEISSLFQCTLMMGHFHLQRGLRSLKKLEGCNKSAVRNKNKKIEKKKKLKMVFIGKGGK